MNLCVDEEDEADWAGSWRPVTVADVSGFLTELELWARDWDGRGLVLIMDSLSGFAIARA